MAWIGIIGLGLIAGYLIGCFTRCTVHLYTSHLYTSHAGRSHYDLGLLDDLDKGIYNSHTSDNNLVLIGVMTAKRFLSSRALAVHQTWRKSIPGNVLFFSSEGSENEAPSGLPVIGLRKVDDSYPPQKKAFMMLKFMHDHFLHKFKYFMRADDDVYVRGDRLGQLLHSIDGSRIVFLGQTGLGKRKDVRRLYLNSSENFCMGGPGVVFSQRTLALVVSNLGTCLKNLYTTEEDVELGRCVARFAGVPCTWAYEMMDIFHHNFKDPNGSYTRPLKDEAIDNSVTLHPVKNASFQYRMHQYFQSLKIVKLRSRLRLLQREVNDVVVNKKLEDRDEFHQPRERNETISWDFFSKSVFATKASNPKHAFEVDRKTSLDSDVAQVLKLMNQNYRTGPGTRTYSFKNLLHGYSRVNPLFGVDYRFYLQLFYRNSSRTGSAAVPVKQSTYARQPFLEVEFEEEGRPTSAETTEIGKRASTNLGMESADVSDRLNVRVNFIVPLAGRYETLLRFVHNFEDACLKNGENVSLVIMLYSTEEEEENKDEETTEHIQKLKTKYPDYELRVISRDGPFSRGAAIQHASSLFAENELLFFVDVDIYFHQNALRRVRLSAVAGRSVYFPIMFRQYDPRLVREKDEISRTSPVDFDSQSGYWQNFAFGIVAVINSDFSRSGGFNLNIKGWGKEDVELYDKFISCNMSIFRSVDTGLVHIFHSIVCDPNLDPAQHKMCIGSKAMSYASTDELASYVFQTSEIFNRNETSAQQ